MITTTARRAASLVTAFALTMGGMSAAAAGTADATVHAAATPTAQPACGSVSRGHARCYTLIRTDAGVRAAAARADLAATPPPGFGATDLESAYSLPISDGAGQTIALVDAYNDPTAATDLQTYRAQYGLPPCTAASGCFTKVNEKGNKGPYPATDGGWAVEESLDVDMVSAACPQCHILLVEGDSNSIADLAASVATAARLGADVISNSYGASEFGGMQSFYADYHPAHAAVVASSGDLGFTAAQFPAVAPGVTAVGGTSLYTSTNRRGWIEHAWSGASSGCSAYVNKPAYQHDTHCGMRTVADVSSVADPNTGLALYDTTPNPYGLAPGWLEVGGTSAASPFIAGTIGLAGNGTTFRTVSIYNHSADLWDVVGGSNGFCGGDYLCTGKKGYDGPTGMGTPDGIRAF